MTVPRKQLDHGKQSRRQKLRSRDIFHHNSTHKPIPPKRRPNPKRQAMYAAAGRPMRESRGGVWRIERRECSAVRSTKVGRRWCVANEGFPVKFVVREGITLGNGGR